MIGRDQQSESVALTLLRPEGGGGGQVKNLIF